MDVIDAKIIRALQANGRMSNLQLSQQVGLSPSPCLRRTKALEDSGVITGYASLVDERKYGCPLILFVNVKLSSHTADAVAKFETLIAQCEEVLECYLITGRSDYILRVMCQDNDHYNAIVRNVFQRIDCVSEIDSTIAYSCVKRSLVYPMISKR